MNETAPAAAAPPASLANSAAPTRRGFWQRRLIDPIGRQLTQGVTPREISFTLAAASVCGLFPFLGFTWLLNLVVGIVFRLNQPILQTLNQLMTPLHLPMILVYVRIGEWMWQAEAEPFSVIELVKDFADLPFSAFINKFGWAGVHAATAWLASAPLLFAVTFLVVRPIIDRLARLRFPAAG